MGDPMEPQNYALVKYKQAARVTLYPKRFQRPDSSILDRSVLCLSSAAFSDIRELEAPMREL